MQRLSQLLGVNMFAVHNAQYLLSYFNVASTYTDIVWCLYFLHCCTHLQLYHFDTKLVEHPKLKLADRQ